MGNAEYMGRQGPVSILILKGKNNEKSN